MNFPFLCFVNLLGLLVVSALMRPIKIQMLHSTPHFLQTFFFLAHFPDIFPVVSNHFVPPLATYCSLLTKIYALDEWLARA